MTDKPTSRSYIPRFTTNDLVMVEGVCGMCKVHPDSQYHGPFPWDESKMDYEFYTTDRRYPGTVKHGGEDGVRAPTLREFLWYRDPEFGHMKVGNWHGWLIVAINALAMLILGTAIHSILIGDGAKGWLALVAAIGAAVPVLTIVGAARNLKGKQM